MCLKIQRCLAHSIQYLYPLLVYDSVYTNFHIDLISLKSCYICIYTYNFSEYQANNKKKITKIYNKQTLKQEIDNNNISNIETVKYRPRYTYKTIYLIFVMQHNITTNIYRKYLHYIEHLHIFPCHFFVGIYLYIFLFFFVIFRQKIFNIFNNFMVFVFKNIPDKSVTLSGNWHTMGTLLPLNTQLKKNQTAGAHFEQKLIAKLKLKRIKSK